MRSIVFVLFLMVTSVNATGAPLPMEIKGLMPGITPDEFVAKVKSIYKGCKSEEEVKRYKTMPDSIESIEVKSLGECNFYAKARFGMVDRKAFEVYLDDFLPKEKNVLVQDVVKSLKDKYGNESTRIFDEYGISKVLWATLPNGGVMSDEEFKSKGSDCLKVSVSYVPDYNSSYINPLLPDFKNCVSFVLAGVYPRRDNDAFSAGYGVFIVDANLVRKFWENDIKVIREYQEKEKTSIEKASKANAPKI